MHFSCIKFRSFSSEKKDSDQIKHFRKTEEITRETLSLFHP